MPTLRHTVENFIDSLPDAEFLSYFKKSLPQLAVYADRWDIADLKYLF